MDSMDYEIAETDEQRIKLEQELASLSLDSEQSPLINLHDEKLKYADVEKQKKLLFILKNLIELTDKGLDFVGAGPLFNCILSLLMQPDLLDQERRFVLKVTNRVVYRLNEFVQPYVHEILAVIQPMLIHERYYTNGREIIFNLNNGAGLETMISAMHRNIDSINENVKETTWITFNVVASTHGVSVLLPFLEAVCQDSKSWHTRCTGMKIVGQFAVQVGSEAVLHLKELVGIIRNGLIDENDRVKIMTGLCIAALAQAAEGCSDGIYGFENVLNPMLRYIFKRRGRARIGEVCAAFLKAFVSLIRLMDGASARYFAVEVVVSLYGGEFGSPYDEEIKETVMKLMEKYEITFD